MNMELLKVNRWDLQHIEERTKQMISEICNLYPYPNVKVASVDEDDDVVDEKEALEIAIKAVGEQLETIKKGACYKSSDNVNGYFFIASKMYLQGNKEKYWNGLRFKRFEQLKDCKNENLILICRHKDVVVLKLTKAFLEKIKGCLNTSLDEDGNIKHYHVVVFINPNNSVSMLLSKPELKEIDISEFVISGGASKVIR